MSRVYFHSPSGEAELWGGERAHLSGLCNRVTLGLLNVRHNGERIAEFIDVSGEGSYLARPEPRDFAAYSRWVTSVETAITVGMNSAFAWKGRPLSMFTLELNTALRAGGNPLKLAARIHGQCEIHGWCEGTDRAWLAGIIDEGLESGVLRQNTGYPNRSEDWEGVARFLRERDDEPVVLSYSVTDGFPNRYEAGWEPPPGTDLRPSWWSADEWAKLSEEEREDYHSEARDELWGELPSAAQWRIAMDALRAKSGGLRLDPAKWDGFTFGHELSAFDLLAPDYAERLDRALLPADDGATADA
ncbi:MAG TPA: hypothetical protein VGH54_20265 [Mycobacterium sp.]|jgi:hypothetical protein|uniref:hypothetical protein n=1 Tax=Mycobacterium sp. TaxID=1785 RepID=UPI002F3F3561